MKEEVDWMDIIYCIHREFGVDIAEAFRQAYEDDGALTFDKLAKLIHRTRQQPEASVAAVET